MTPRQRAILRGVVRAHRPAWLAHVDNATEVPLWMRNEMRTWLSGVMEWTEDWESTPYGREIEALIDVLGPHEEDPPDAHPRGPAPDLG